MLTLSSYSLDMTELASGKTHYHHGNLREALLDAVGEIIREKGVGAVSLREAARRAGVSHSAPAHHFGDKLGLLTAYAVRGFALFGERMRAAAASAADPVERLNALGIAYLKFALEEREYFEVMFRSDMHDDEDEQLCELSESVFATLTEVAGTLGDDAAPGADPLATAIASWSTVHGLATLWMDGALTDIWDGDDPYELAAKVFEAKGHGGS